MKEQLTKEKDGRLKNFGYGAILVSFSLERIPLLRPQHISLEKIDVRVPQMRRWIDLMAQHVSLSSMSFTLVFFRWLCTQFIMVDDYPYVGMDFHRNLELTLPVGEQWGVVGKIFWPFFILSFTTTKKLCVFFNVFKTKPLICTCKYWIHSTYRYVISPTSGRPIVGTNTSTGCYSRMGSTTRSQHSRGTCIGRVLYGGVDTWHSWDHGRPTSYAITMTYYWSTRAYRSTTLQDSSCSGMLSWVLWLVY